MQQGKGLSKGVASAGSLVQPDPSGSSELQMREQGWSHVEAEGLAGLAFGRQQFSGEGAAGAFNSQHSQQLEECTSWERGDGQGTDSTTPNSNLLAVVESASALLWLFSPLKP